MGTKRPRDTRPSNQKDPDGLLASAARTVGTVAGGIAKVIGLRGDSPTGPDEQPRQKPRPRKVPAVSRKSPVTAKPKGKAKARGAGQVLRKRTSKPASKRTKARG